MNEQQKPSDKRSIQESQGVRGTVKNEQKADEAIRRMKEGKK
ncbi:hypothetical protein [Bremerella sp. P1]|nr:hypothetical protein [Bremerella sp. P1]WDI40225.1 hypothetical protein PSR63_17230 [Bremerella sp. P1]